MKRLWAYTLEALHALWINRGRSFLTMLGMIIGTASVIAVMGISAAASGGIAATLAASGDPGIQISVDPQQENPAAAQLQFRDVAQLSSGLATLAARVYPVYQRFYRVRAAGIDTQSNVYSSDATSDYRALLAGRRLAAQDIAAAARVCMISSQTFADRMLKGAPSIGASLHLGGTRFVVIGVYDASKGGLFNTAGGDYLEIPYTTFHQLAPGPVDGLIVVPRDRNQTEAVMNAAKRLLQHIHGERTKYDATDVLAIVTGFDKVLRIVSTGLSAIGAVALVVAGIGIMNIMLVSVSERTREIGIRKAIGANRRDIALQFLIESILIALGGGGIGIVLGLLTTIGAASIISGQLGQAIIPYLLLVNVALVFSITIGMAFGTYPAIRAARLDPIEALRS